MVYFYLLIILLPLLGAIIAGFYGERLGRVKTHRLVITLVGAAFALSAWTLYGFFTGSRAVFNGNLYTWLATGGLSIQVGFMVDKLTAMMMVTVTFVSLMVHVYTIGYMSDDEENWPVTSGSRRNSYQRFYAYISLFTFSMLVLIMANNFMLLFFGWEAVGLVSYLLIGFWSTRDTAIYANLKAFLVNRVGDFGMILGIAAVVAYCGSLDYLEVFKAAPSQKDAVIPVLGGISVMTLICILLFIGAMAKSAQIPLHVWLPDSMEGPTPISALIHAATMVTAGIFMIARMSPLYELSDTALSFVLIIGVTTAFLMGMVGIVQNDIKRVIAYSTLSQLGYMIAAMGLSAYAAGLFHLMTHAFFKALLFLAAGSVIIAMHHDQDIRNMGGLWRKLPITWLTFLIGTLALIGMPGFAGFFSKDAIIAASGESTRFGAGYAHLLLTISVLITALYSMRLYFIVFHGKQRMDEHTRAHLRESPWVVTLPLVLLAIPSVVIGWIALEPILNAHGFATGNWNPLALLGTDPLAEVRHHTEDRWAFVLHGILDTPFFLTLIGVGVSFLIWFLLLRVKPDIDVQLQRWGGPLTRILEAKYGFDAFNQRFIGKGSINLGTFLWQRADQNVIDQGMVMGTARLTKHMGMFLRPVQSGYLYHYAMAMILGLIGLMTFFVVM